MIDAKKITSKLPNLHQAACSDSEFVSEEVKDKLPKNILSYRYTANIDPDRDNYDDYVFRCHALGKLVGGLPKPLSPSQLETFRAYEDRYKDYGSLKEGEKGSRGKELTYKQCNDFFSLGEKLTAQVTLAQGAKTYLEELLNQDNLCYSSSLKTNQITKGIVREDDSIELYSKFIGKKLQKNTQRKSNGWWSGEWDLDEDEDTIADIKTSWTRKTFAEVAVSTKSKAYDWQGQGYLDLTGKTKFNLVFCLVDSLPEQVDRIINRLCFDPDYGTISGEIREEAIPAIVEEVTNHFVTREGLEEFCNLSGVVHIEWFDDFYEIPIDKRIKIFRDVRNEEMIENIKKLIVLARQYMNKLMLNEKKTKSLSA